MYERMVKRSDGMVKKSRKMEALLWSIAFPGFGQFLNHKYFKGVVLLLFEFLINVQGRINSAIVHSFNGNIFAAIEESNYLWLMFYPCIYMFGIWDAYKDAGGDQPYLFLPFVFAAYIGTLGVVYSPTFQLFGYYLGPIFLPIICLLLGYLIGWLLKKFIFMKKPTTELL